MLENLSVKFKNDSTAMKVEVAKLDIASLWKNGKWHEGLSKSYSKY